MPGHGHRSDYHSRDRDQGVFTDERRLNKNSMQQVNRRDEESSSRRRARNESPEDGRRHHERHPSKKRSKKSKRHSRKSSFSSSDSSRKKNSERKNRRYRRSSSSSSNDRSRSRNRHRRNRSRSDDRRDSETDSRRSRHNNSRSRTEKDSSNNQSGSSHRSRTDHSNTGKLNKRLEEIRKVYPFMILVKISQFSELRETIKNLILKYGERSSFKNYYALQESLKNSILFKLEILKLEEMYPFISQIENESFITLVHWIEDVVELVEKCGYKEEDVKSSSDVDDFTHGYKTDEEQRLIEERLEKADKLYRAECKKFSDQFNYDPEVLPFDEVWGASSRLLRSIKNHSSDVCESKIYIIESNEKKLSTANIISKCKHEEQRLLEMFNKDIPWLKCTAEEFSFPKIISALKTIKGLEDDVAKKKEAFDNMDKFHGRYALTVECKSSAKHVVSQCPDQNIDCRMGAENEAFQFLNLRCYNQSDYKDDRLLVEKLLLEQLPKDRKGDGIDFAVNSSVGSRIIFSEMKSELKKIEEEHGVQTMICQADAPDRLIVPLILRGFIENIIPARKKLDAVVEMYMTKRRNGHIVEHSFEKYDMDHIMRFKHEIEHFAEKFRMTINIYEEEELIIFNGRNDYVKKAIELFSEVDENEFQKPSPDDQFVYHICIQKAGSVIGKGHQEIRKIRYKSGAKIYLDDKLSEDSGFGKVFVVSGTFKQADAANKMICDKGGVDYDKRPVNHSSYRPPKLEMRQKRGFNQTRST